MRSGDRVNGLEQPQVAPRCPTCGSADVVTTSKIVTAASYWRCASCGDVWNVERQRKGSRYVARTSYGR